MLKVGALVMFTKNNPQLGFANGTLGRVERFEMGTGDPVIETHDGRSITVPPMDWAVEENGRVRAKVSQVPLRLAWAITIHKSQGMSMDQAAMDLSRIFEHGQGYVALSRVRSLAGLHLLGWSESALSVHPEVSRIDHSFRELSDAAETAFSILSENGEREEMEKNFIRAAGGSLEKTGKPAPKKTTVEETQALLKNGNDIDQIAELRSLTVGTICDHLEKLIKSGDLARAEIKAAIPERIQKHEAAIHNALEKVGHEKLAPVFSLLKGKHSYDDLRIARLTFIV
jgi:hypothetical protein